MERKLCEAVKRGDIQLVKRLLKLGVDVNTRDENMYGHGNTLLIQACLNDDKEMVEFLLTKSVDVNVTGLGGFTALITAAMIGLYDIIDILLKTKDINVMKGDILGMTAIHWAAWNNHVTIVERLVSCSVPVDINDNYGCTPLWFAARYGRVRCVDVLLKHGASPQHESEWYGSPLEVARQFGHSNVIVMMEEAIRLTSHPYVEGRMSVMRHQYQQTLVEQQSEIMRLRTAAADTVCEGHTVSDESWVLSQPPELIMLAVSALACDRWSDVGLALDYTASVLIAHTASIADPCSKLHFILRTKAESVGARNVVHIILSACQQISMPICAAAIRDEVERQERLKTQNSGQ